MVYFQGHAAPGIYARGYLKAAYRKRRCITSAGTERTGGACRPIRIRG